MNDFFKRMREDSDSFMDKMLKKGEEGLKQIEGLNEEQIKTMVEEGNLDPMALLIGLMKKGKDLEIEECSKFPKLEKDMILVHKEKNYQVKVVSLSEVNPYAVEIIPVDRKFEDELYEELTTVIDPKPPGPPIFYVGKNKKDIYKTSSIYTTNLKLLDHFNIL